MIGIILASLVAAGTTTAVLYLAGYATKLRGQVAGLQAAYFKERETTAILLREKTLVENERDHIKAFQRHMMENPFQAVVQQEQFDQLVRGVVGAVNFHLEKEADPDNPKPQTRKPN